MNYRIMAGVTGLLLLVSVSVGGVLLLNETTAETSGEDPRSVDSSDGVTESPNESDLSTPTETPTDTPTPTPRPEPEGDIGLNTQESQEGLTISGEVSVENTRDPYIVLYAEGEEKYNESVDSSFEFNTYEGYAPEARLELWDSGTQLDSVTVSIAEGTRNIELSTDIDLVDSGERQYPRHDWGENVLYPGGRVDVEVTVENTGTLPLEDEVTISATGVEYSSEVEVPAGGTDSAYFDVYTSAEMEPILNVSAHLQDKTAYDTRPLYYDTDGDGLPSYWEEVTQETPGGVDLSAAEAGQLDIIIDVAYHEDIEPLSDNEKNQIHEWFGNMPIEKPNGQEGINVILIEEENAQLADHTYDETFGRSGGINGGVGYSYGVGMTVFETDRYDGAATGTASVVNGEDNRRAYILVHEVLHGIVGDIEDDEHASCHDNDERHSCSGFLSPNVGEEYLPEPIGEQIEEDGVVPF